MNRVMDFAGGLLVGFGISAYLFGALIWNMMHHMFIIGITSKTAFAFFVACPALLILLGTTLPYLRKNVA